MVNRINFPQIIGNPSIGSRVFKCIFGATEIEMRKFSCESQNASDIVAKSAGAYI